MLSSVHPLEKAKTGIVAAAGGSARLQIIAVLAMVLGLDMADNGTISAIADPLKGAFHVGNTEFGLLLSVTSFAAAITTLPMGVLADRIPRRSILLVVVPLWAVVMIVSGTASSYGYLVGTRVALGAVEAAAWPCIASLTGDFFPAQDRAATYGLILAGELIGMGIGFFVSGQVAGLIGWHWSFYAMAALSAPLAWVVWRYLPEPARGTQNWIEIGETDPNAASPQANEAGSQESAGELSAVQKKVRQSGAQPREALILREDPTHRSTFWAIGYFLRLPTYNRLVAASSLVYYFFVGFSAFVMAYYTRHYKLSHDTVATLVFVVGIGAIVGVVAGGRVSERVMKRGRFTARVVVPAITLLASIPFFAFSFWIRNAWFGVPSLTAAAGLLAAGIAPLDAARLDIIHPRMWGRAEGGRTAIRSVFEGCAPLLFGAMSGWLGGGDTGLMWSFLVMLIAMLLAGWLALSARHTYLSDVATAAASVKATGGRET